MQRQAQDDGLNHLLDGPQLGYEGTVRSQLSVDAHTVDAEGGTDGDG